MRFPFTLLLILGLCLPTLLALTPTDLRVDGMSAPLGVDSAFPVFSWKHRDEGARGARQTAYQLQVATSPAVLEAEQADLLDTGKVSSAAQAGIPYGGKRLSSFATATWRVRVWDGNDRPGEWSQPTSWTMGALDPSDWKASWISDAPLLRLRRTALGYHSEVTRQADTVKWLLIDLGAPHPVEEVKLQGVAHSAASGLGFPVRFRIETSDTPDFATVQVLLDQSGADYPNAWAASITAKAAGTPVRYVRVTANRLRTEDDGSCRFALSQVLVKAAGRNVAVGARVTASDSLEGKGWSAASVTDGMVSPGEDPLANSTLLVRREFQVGRGLRRALLLSCGLGHHEATLNGRRVGEDLFSTAWTRHESECLYDTRDVSTLLRTGPNALGFVLAGGFYNVQPSARYTKLTTAFRPLMLIALLRLEYDDGRIETIGTDQGWQVSRGPILFSNMYGGEDYDARLEPRGWDQPGFAAASWRAAVPDRGPGGVLKGSSHSAPPIRVQELLRAHAPRVVDATTLVYDLGQNASIIPRLRVRGPAGSRIRITPSELVAPDGKADQRSVLHGGVSYCTYMLSGEPEGETWQPRFFYHGARYLQLTLSTPAGQALPTVSSVEGLVVHSASAPAGDFECSNELFNRIRTLVRWAQRSNSFHVLTDCPHRERLGWIEQYYLNGPALRYEFDYARLFRKGLNDMAASQTEQGLIPSINPEYVIFRGGFRDSPEWGSAFILAAWQQYEWTGDRSLLERHYEAMRRYVAYLGTKATEHILRHGLGDWYDLGPKRPGSSQLTPIPLTATATYYTASSTLARIAALLGRRTEALEYQQLADQIRTAFNTRFLNAADSVYGSGSQTSNAMPLALGMVPSEHQGKVLEAIVSDIRSKGDAFTAGDVGYRYLLRALAEGGRSDVIYSMNNQSERPGYGFQLAQGCTSLAESWTAERNSSHNHFMLGQITEWFYGDLAGIRPDPDAPGFARVLIFPTPVAGLDWVRASHESPRGLIRSEWRRENGRFILELLVPPNTQARVRVPHDRGAAVTESNAPAGNQPGIVFERGEPTVDTYSVSSGKYRFETLLSL